MATGLLDFFSSVWEEACTFAIKSWLDRFLGFVDEWALYLQHYNTTLHTIESDFASNGPNDNPAGQRTMLGALLMHFCTAYRAGQLQERAYHWCTARACRALGELNSADWDELEVRGGDAEVGLLASALALLPSVSPKSEALPTDTLPASSQLSMAGAATSAPVRLQAKIVMSTQSSSKHGRNPTLPTVRLWFPALCLLLISVVFGLPQAPFKVQAQPEPAAVLALLQLQEHEVCSSFHIIRFLAGTCWWGLPGPVACCFPGVAVIVLHCSSSIQLCYGTAFT